VQHQDLPLTSSVEGIMPERPDLASERPLPEPDAAPPDEPAEPDDPPAEENGLEEVVTREHPLS
jgi:hypothetical protein